MLLSHYSGTLKTISIPQYMQVSERYLAHQTCRTPLMRTTDAHRLLGKWQITKRLPTELQPPNWAELLPHVPLLKDPQNPKPTNVHK